MVPFEALSTEAPHSSMVFCNGCVRGTQCESLRVTVLSCAATGAVSAASAAPIRNMRILSLASRRWVPLLGSIGRLVLLQSLFQLLHDGAGIAARLAHVVRPHLVQRLGRLLPLVELFVGNRIDLASWHRLHLGEAGVLEVAPRVGELARPFGGAMIVDHLLLCR